MTGSTVRHEGNCGYGEALNCPLDAMNRRKEAAIGRHVTGWLGAVLLLCASAIMADAAGTTPDAQKSPWVGPVCDRAWEYQGELAQRTVPERVWESLSHEGIEGELDPNLVQRLDRVLDSLRVLCGAPAIGVALGIPGEGLWTGTVGVARASPEESLADTALFHAGSIGKAFTATLVMQLIEERHLDLHTSIVSWFHTFPNARWMSVDHLLTHTSGAHNFSDLKRFQRHRGFTAPEDLIEAAAKGAPRFCPGAQWNDSNTGYVMLGRIVERLRGLSLQEALQRDIIGRLKLASTVPRWDRDEVPGHVTGYDHGEPVKKVSYALPHGAGIVSTTPDDLVRFWHALLTGRLVSEASVRTMCTDMYPMFGGEETHYGRGIMTYDVPGPGLIIGHGGRISGFRSVVGYVVEDGVYVAVLANDDAPVEAALFHVVRTLRAWRNATAR